MPDLPTENKRVVLAERPDRGPITSKTFKFETSKLDTGLGEGQILVKVLYTSIVSLSLISVARVERKQAQVGPRIGTVLIYRTQR
jgi:NADPH-dependent curcumin reductase CurA